MNYQLHKHNDATETARAVAERILQQALAKADVGQKLHVAVSGGSTPKLLFEIMGEEFQYKMPWQSINIFWVDERCVAPTHPESNYGMTYDALLRKSYIPNDNIFRIKGEEMPIVANAEQHDIEHGPTIAVRQGFAQKGGVTLGLVGGHLLA